MSVTLHGNNVIAYTPKSFTDNVVYVRFSSKNVHVGEPSISVQARDHGRDMYSFDDP